MSTSTLLTINGRVYGWIDPQILAILTAYQREVDRLNRLIDADATEPAPPGAPTASS